MRLDFVSFAQRCFHELNPRTQFAMNRHIEIIAATLRAGKIRRLIIKMPPRYLKSLLASVSGGRPTEWFDHTLYSWLNDKQKGAS